VKRYLWTIAKWAISCALLAWIFAMPKNREALASLATTQWSGSWVALGGLWCLVAVLVTMVRWFWLVRGLNLPCTFREALRLGFLGYLLNFVSLGSVGGDLFKALFLARMHPERKTAAVATVVVDRWLGLLGLLVVASVAGFGVYGTDNATIATLIPVTWTLTVLGLLAWVWVQSPGFTSGPIWAFLLARPKLGKLFGDIHHAVGLYRNQLGLTLSCLGMSVLAHSFFVLTFMSLCAALPLPAGSAGQPAPTYPNAAVHWVVSPLALLAGTLPLPGGGLGAFEAAAETLYEQVGGYSQGIVLAFLYRGLTLVIALIGGVYYLVDQQQVRAILAEEDRVLASESENDSGPPEDSPARAATLNGTEGQIASP